MIPEDPTFKMLNRSLLHFYRTNANFVMLSIVSLLGTFFNAIFARHFLQQKRVKLKFLYWKNILKFSTGGEDGAGFAPSFIEKPKIIPNEDGTLILLRCKCTANPKPVVTWYKGTKTVTETSKIKMRVTEQENNYEMILELQVIWGKKDKIQDVSKRYWWWNIFLGSCRTRQWHVSMSRTKRIRRE